MPLTLANVQAYTGASRAEVSKVFDAMASAGAVELDSDDDGNLFYTVGGAARIPRGATTVGEVMKLEALRSEVAGPTGRNSRALALHDGNPGDKSVVVSGLLAFFLGPLGLLYAAPFVEAVVPIAVLIALGMVLPPALLSSIVGVLLPAFGVAGAVYAVRHNKNGRRTSLLPAPKKQKQLR